MNNIFDCKQEIIKNARIGTLLLWIQKLSKFAAKEADFWLSTTTVHIRKTYFDWLSTHLSCKYPSLLSMIHFIFNFTTVN